MPDSSVMLDLCNILKISVNELLSGEMISMEKKNEKQEGSSALMTGIMIVSVILALGLALVLFKVIPETLWEGLTRLVPKLDGSGYVFNILRGAFTGIIKIAILVGYMAAVSLMKDIKRTFMYHGAEHKTIYCFENGEELTIENARKYTTLHPRCGTSFLMIVMVISILLFTLFGALVGGIVNSNIFLRIITKLALLPLIAGVSYEVLKWLGRAKDTPIIRILKWPGLMTQKLTTKEPDRKMVEVAIVSVEAVFDWKQYLKDTFGI